MLMLLLHLARLPAEEENKIQVMMQQGALLSLMLPQTS
jgi:hypothetical protein